MIKFIEIRLMWLWKAQRQQPLHRPLVLLDAAILAFRALSAESNARALSAVSNARARASVQVGLNIPSVEVNLTVMVVYLDGFCCNWIKAICRRFDKKLKETT